MEEDEAELRIVLRGLLTSRCDVIKSSQLLKDFKDEEGRNFPYRNLNFNTFVDYLKSIPTVCKLVPSNSYDPEVHPVASDKSKHIDELVSKQKTPARRGRGGRGGRSRGRPPIQARYAGYTPRPNPPPLQRRPPSLPPPPTRISPAPQAASAPKVPTECIQDILWSLVKQVAISNKNGVYVHQLEEFFHHNYNKEDLSKCGVKSGADLLQHTKDMVKIVNDRVYPDTSYKFDSEQYYSSKQYKNNGHNGEDYSSQGASNYNCFPASVGGKKEDEEYESYDEYDDENFWQNDEEYISNYTIGLCSKLKESEENNNTSKNVQEDESSTLENDEHQFSKKMISNFRVILEKNPDGVWTSELVKKYKEYFCLELDLLSLGYSSAINMVARLPNVFSYERVKSHDWILYDARKFNKASAIQEKPEARQNNIPSIIVENIRALVRESGSAGVNSLYLLEKYQLKYKKSIDISTLGFQDMKQFLIELEQKGIFTLRDMGGFYHIQKKHELIPLQDKRPAQSSDAAVINPVEAVSILIPEFVCRLGTTIEPQKLPEINMAGKENEPLIEMAVKIGEVISPREFYLILDTCWNDLECLMEDLKNLYVQEEKKFKIPLPYFAKGLYCAVQYQGADGDWHRARTVEFAADDQMKIDYIDYGTPATVKRSELRFLHTSFASLPAQGIMAKLINIKPSKGAKKWSLESKTEFLNLITEKRLIAHVYRIATNKKQDRMQLEVILYDTTDNKPLIINEHLVEKGFADFENNNGVNSDSQPEVIPDHMSAPHSSRSSSASTNNSVPTQMNVDLPKTTVLPPPGFEPQSQNASSLGTNQAMYINMLASMNMLRASGASLPPAACEALIMNNLFLSTSQNQVFNQILPAAYNTFNTQPYNSQQNWPQAMSCPTPSTFNQPPPPCNQFFYPYHPSYYNATNVPLPNPAMPPYLPTMPQYMPNPQIPIPLHEASSAPPNQEQNNSRLLPNFLPQQSTQPMGPQAKPLVECEFTVSPPPTYDEVIQQQHNSIKSPSKYIDEAQNNADGNRPKTPLTPVSAEITNVFRRSRNDSDKSQLSHTSEKLEETIQDQFPFHPRSEQIEDHRNCSAGSEEFYSSEENIVDIKLEDHVLESGVTSTVNTDNNNDKDSLPDNWEDFEADDAPVKVLSPIFKREELCVNKNEVEGTVLNKEADVLTKCLSKGSTLPLPGTVELPVTNNWKDIFNPDIKRTFVRPCDLIIPEITSSKPDIKKTELVQKITEFTSKPFHLIIVNDEPAVVAKEFYPLFTSHQWSIIEKLAQTRSMEFSVIKKIDHEELFEELKKAQFGTLLKRGKLQISYLSEVSNMLLMLKSQDKRLSEYLKEILTRFDKS